MFPSLSPSAYLSRIVDCLVCWVTQVEVWLCCYNILCDVPLHGLCEVCRMVLYGACGAWCGVCRVQLVVYAHGEGRVIVEQDLVQTLTRHRGGGEEQGETETETETEDGEGEEGRHRWMGDMDGAWSMDMMDMDMDSVVIGSVNEQPFGFQVLTRF